VLIIEICLLKKIFQNVLEKETKKYKQGNWVYSWDRSWYSKKI